MGIESRYYIRKTWGITYVWLSNKDDCFVFAVEDVRFSTNNYADCLTKLNSLDEELRKKREFIGEAEIIYV